MEFSENVDFQATSRETISKMIDGESPRKQARHLALLETRDTSKKSRKTSFYLTICLGICIIVYGLFVFYLQIG